MSKKPELSHEAIDLLFQLLELPEPLLASGAAELHPAPTKLLIAAGLLTNHDHEMVVSSTDDHDDVPLSLDWSAEAGALTYFSPVVGPVKVSEEQLRRRRVGIGRTIAALTAGFDFPDNTAPFELIEGLLWEIGDARLGRRSARVPVWFGRRLWDRSVQQQIIAAAAARPHPRQRVLLTSSRGGRIRDFAVRGATIVPLRDVLVSPERLAVSPEILGQRFGGFLADDPANQISLSPDGRKLRINGGEPIPFRSESQIEAIRRFVAAYKAGDRIRAIDITETGNLSNFFGAKKWERLSPFLKSDAGLWGFEP